MFDHIPQALSPFPSGSTEPNVASMAARYDVLQIVDPLAGGVLNPEFARSQGEPLDLSLAQKMELTSSEKRVTGLKENQVVRIAKNLNVDECAHMMDLAMRQCYGPHWNSKAPPRQDVTMEEVPEELAAAGTSTMAPEVVGQRAVSPEPEKPQQEQSPPRYENLPLSARCSVIPIQANDAVPTRLSDMEVNLIDLPRGKVPERVIWETLAQNVNSPISFPTVPYKKGARELEPLRRHSHTTIQELTGAQQRQRTERTLGIWKATFRRITYYSKPRITKHIVTHIDGKTVHDFTLTFNNMSCK